MDGLMMVGLPESSVVLIQAISRKKGLTIVQVLSESLAAYAKKHLTEDDLKQLQQQAENELKKPANR